MLALKLLHLLCFVYWLGGDLGTFYASHFVARTDLTPAARLVAAKIMMGADLAPRVCMPLTLASGVHLALQSGHLAGPVEAAAGVWVLCLLWLAGVLSLHHAAAGRTAWLVQLDFAWRVLLVAGLLSPVYAQGAEAANSALVQWSIITAGFALAIAAASTVAGRFEERERWRTTRRRLVAGMKVVTGKGDLLELNKDLIKNATGYDMRQLFIGAEGTLGFVVEATMRLERTPKNLTAMVLGTPDFDSIMPVLHAFQSKLDLTAFEFFSDKALAKVLARGDVPRAFETDCPFYALLEFEATTEEVANEALATFEHCVEQGWVLDGVMSQSQQQLENLWKLREYISETISHWTPYKNDISVTVGQVPAFLHDIDRIVGENYPDFEVVWFGHIGDGNLHLNILKPENLGKDEFFAKCATVNKWVFETVEKYNGSISAEHGVGMTKRDYLTYTRSETEIAYMKALKAVFDPNGIMNPGKIFAE